jgi:hypothetical protein
MFSNSLRKSVKYWRQSVRKTYEGLLYTQPNDHSTRLHVVYYSTHMIAYSIMCVLMHTHMLTRTTHTHPPTHTHTHTHTHTLMKIVERGTNVGNTPLIVYTNDIPEPVYR